MSQQELAHRSGLGPGAINHFVRGRRLPSLDNFLKLAESLNVSADYLLGRTDQPDVPGTAGTNDDLIAIANMLNPSQQRTLIGIAKTLASETG
jgi:transcriptional regulator with XRE-family HTH domain